MPSPASKLLLMGLRGSGKTSYLAALWHSLEAAELVQDFSIPALQSDREYLNEIRNNWLSFKPVGRTSMRSTNHVSLQLYDKHTDRQFELSLPDLSGESYRLQWATRRATNTYAALAPEVDGILLFIHPFDMTQTHPLTPISEDVAEDTLPIVNLQTIQPSKNWDPTKTATQVQLVDILQLFIRLRGTGRPLKVSLIISAWDTIKSPITPDDWFERKMPLIAQYLRANRDWLSSEVFGVSAQGGDLVEDRKQLESVALTSARCTVLRGGDRNPVPLSTPLQFVLASNE